MATYLEQKKSQFESDPSGQVRLSDVEVQEEERWNPDDPAVALDHLIAVFRRRGLVRGDAVLLPVHESESASLTGEYVLYTEDEYGHSLQYYNTDNEAPDFIEYDNASRSGLLYRLRFWDRRFSNPDDLLSDVLDDRPPYRPNPISAESPMSDDEYSTFVDETLEFVRTELLSQHQGDLDTIVGHGVDVDRSGGGVVRSTDIHRGPSTITCNVDLPSSESLGRMYEPVEDVYDIYEGNTVALLWEDDYGGTAVLDGIITRIDGRSIVIDDGFGTYNRESVDLSEVGQVTLRVVEKGVAERREYEAFKQLSERSESLLRGDSNIDFSSPLDLDFIPDLELNTYQERAAVDALCADDVFCIHGPPGTGKTRTLVTIIEHAVENGDTVLVCAHSNQAVDNIVAGESTTEVPDEASLHRIVQRFSAEDELREISMVRIGSSRQDVDSFVASRYYTPTSRLDSNIGSPNIIASTTNTAAVLDDRDDVNLDLVVIDEATQASGPATAVPFGWGNRVEETDHGRLRSVGYRTILAGDHRQLPPFVSDPEMRDRGLHASLFERLLDVYGEDLAQTLYRQYRMHESIAEFASQEFYDGRLEHGEDNRTATIDGLSPLLAIDDNSGEAQNSSSNSYHNPTEAQYVVAQVQRALNHDVDASDIGVITGYSDQREVIRSELVNSIEGLEYNSVDVETIDKFQGGQREVIIVSFTRSNPESDSGFLESPPQTARKRLNVAITRAKKRLVLIGDWETLSTPAVFRDSSESCADTFARLRDYLQDRDCMVSNRS